MKTLSQLITTFVFAAFSFAVQALDFRSVSTDAAILYDAPSQNSKKTYVISRDYPVEVVIEIEGWCKVRDNSGELSWIEKKDLAPKRTLLVVAPVAPAYQSPDSKSAVVFRAEQNVVLEFLEQSEGGWIKVKHRDGQVGYVQVVQVWGI
jgi:SH3-like domain-containing protein